jgi:hypothetical protein
MNTLHVEDFVVLGRTVPEESKKFGTRICMAGYSAGINQFLRVYPLMVPVGENANTNGFRARHMYCLELRRNDLDNRPESWRLLDEKKPTATRWDTAPEVTKAAVTRWLGTREVQSIEALNESRVSLGVLRVKAADWTGVMVPRSDDAISEAERTLFDDLEEQPEIDANRIKHIPYIKFTDRSGAHRLQVREWGAYRLLVQPRYAETPEVLWGASGYRTGQDLLVVVGNMCNYRTNWLIIKTFEVTSSDDGPGLFDS